MMQPREDDSHQKYRLITIPVPPLATNCYLLIDKATNQAAVFDPGSAAQRIYDLAAEAGAEIAAIINTHGHWDHVGGNIELRQLSGAPIMIHADDAEMLSQPELNMSPHFHVQGRGGTAARLLREGDSIEVGGLSLSVIHTPGHTPGGICLVCEDLLFSGDTLFQLSVGRSDLPGGDEDELMDSLAQKLRPLPGNLRVLPGHGPESRLEYELKYNPYFPR